MLSAIFAHLSIMRSFELTRTKIVRVMSASYTHLRILRSYEFKGTLFEGVHCKFCTFEGTKII